MAKNNRTGVRLWNDKTEPRELHPLPWRITFWFLWFVLLLLLIGYVAFAFLPEAVQMDVLREIKCAWKEGLRAFYSR